jgi:hypothetical protein
MKQILQLILFTGILIGLPLAGVTLAGHDPSRYLAFPPTTGYVEHLPFSWTAFILIGLLVIAALAPFLVLLLKWIRQGKPGEASTADYSFTGREIKPASFPAWAWIGVILLPLLWFMAWTRFEWFASFQRYTFTPLWLCYIIIVNGLTFRRSGYSLVTHRPGLLAALFPVSAFFWWFFEYLNRFVANWYYVGGGTLSGERYFFEATLAFSTVLPAVLSTRELLLTFPVFSRPFRRTVSLPMDSRAGRFLPGLIGLAALSLVGVFPEYLFPFLWVAPLLLWHSLQELRGYRNRVAGGIIRGDWTLFWVSAAAALVCGIFWETWNYWSLAKWIYSIPLVDRFPVFEMPLLGYAGYLPFGLEIALIGDEVDLHFN